MENKIKYRFRRENFTPKKHEPTSVKDVMNNIVKSFKMDARYNNAVIISSWEKIMGAPIASRTESVFVKRRVLFLQVNTPVLRNELSMNKARIIAKINEYLKTEAIVDVKFF